MQALLLFFVLTMQAFALTEQAFIQKVLNQDTHFEKDQIYVTIKKIELDASRQSYAGWNTDLTATLENSYYDISKDTDSTSSYAKKRIKNQQSIKLETEKRFLDNPGSLNISATRSTPDTNIERYKQSDYHDNYNISTFDNSYKISYKYPLLKHDSNAASLKTYHRNILDLQREKFDFDDAQEGFLVDRLEQYLLWSLYEENAKVYAKYLQELLSIKVVKDKDKAKLKTAILLTEKDILENQSQLKAQKEELIVALNDPSLLTQKPELNHAKSPNIIKADLAQYLRKNSRTLLKYKIDQELKSIDLKYYKNQSKIKLDFSISAEQDVNKGNTLTTKYDNDSVDYVAGFELSIPIGTDVSAQEDIVVAQLNLRKLVIDFDNKLKDIKADAQALAVKLKLDKEVLNNYDNVIVSMVADVNSVRDNYLKQSIPIKDLLDIYKEKRDVELERADSIIEYHQNILEYNDELDRVLPR